MDAIALYRKLRRDGIDHVTALRIANTYGRRRQRALLLLLATRKG